MSTWAAGSRIGSVVFSNIASRRRTRIVARCVGVLLLSVIATDSQPQGLQNASIVALIGCGQCFDGKSVRTEGFWSLESDESALYLHREDAERALTMNGIKLLLTEKSLETYRSAGKQYVLVEGVFTAPRAGSLNIYSGHIDRVTRIEVVPSRREIGSWKLK